jgi:DeoR/GlpR family transcriptional regulator of sugar metabolism
VITNLAESLKESTMKSTSRQRVYAAKIRNVLNLMIQMQTRPMHVHVISKELQVTERTAYRYLAMFNELGFKLNRTTYGAYTIIQNDSSNNSISTPVGNRTRPARRINQNPKAE